MGPPSSPATSELSSARANAARCLMVSYRGQCGTQPVVPNAALAAVGGFGAAMLKLRPTCETVDLHRHCPSGTAAVAPESDLKLTCMPGSIVAETGTDREGATHSGAKNMQNQTRLVRGKVAPACRAFPPESARDRRK